MAAQVHVFQSTTFNKPTWCDYCEKFMWGFVRQGKNCKCCGFNAHRKCISFVEAPCIPSNIHPLFGNDSMSINTKDLPHSSTNSLLAGMNDGASVHDRDTSVDSDTLPSMILDSGVTSPTSRSSFDSFFDVSKNESPEDARPRASIDNGSIWNDLMKTTAMHAAQREQQAKQGTQPPLNLMTTTPKNMTRFINRIGPAVNAQEEIIEILSWRSPLKSAFWLLVYTILCLRPLMLVMLPQITIIVLSLHRQYRKTKRLAMKQSKYCQNIQYLKNLQFIQNFMGVFVTAHDNLKEKMQVFKWEDEGATWQALKWTVLSIFAVVGVVLLIPLNYLALIAGWLLFVQNTPLFQATSDVLAPLIVSHVQTKAESLRERLNSSAAAILEDGFRPSFSAPSTPVSKKVTIRDEASVTFVDVFENQRWWSGLGWIPHLLKSERAAWTDITGQDAKPSKDQIDLPGASWEWMDSQWILDIKWAKTDPEGWVYTDHMWHHPVDKSNMTTLTRRRKWRRAMVMTTKEKMN